MTDQPQAVTPREQRAEWFLQEVLDRMDARTDERGLMTDQPQTPAEPEQPAEETVEVEVAMRDLERDLEVRRMRRMRAPVVTMSVQVPTDESSWGDVDDEATAAVLGTTWNQPYRVRGGDRTIKARRMTSAFTFTDYRGRLFDCERGDWLIREDETGFVFALTDHAMGFMFEPVEASAPADSAQP